MLRWWGFLAAVVSLALALPAGATTIVRVADEDLVDQAPLVVVARVAARAPAAGGAAATDYRIEVDRVLKGAAGPDLVVRVPGGVDARGFGRRVYGAPSFAPGDRALLFLEPRAGGEHRVLHLAQGAFRVISRDGRELAVRDLSEVVELRREGDGIVAAPAASLETTRDFAAFADWIDARARGRATAADYRVELPSRVEGSSRIAAPFELFTDPEDGTLLRWFVFDTGGQVPWRFGTGGQPGVPGGGQAQFQSALQTWNADAQTPIRLTFAGTSSATGGLEIFDQLNVILFGDPNGELGPLSANCSGTLALGGGGYNAIPQSFRGTTYYPFIEGDIVVNDGLECFFAGSPDAGAAAAELFAHEVGHTLGIAHSNVADALMSAFIHDDGRGARLHADDLAAARALYRPGSNQPPVDPPAAPSELVAEPLSTTEVAVAWQDNSDDETGFVVEIAELGGLFVPLDPPLPPNTSTAEVINLEPATGFRFRVRAINANGSSAPSNEAQVSTNALPGPCLPGAQTLCLTGGRFRVEVDWATSQGTSGEGQVVPGVSSNDSGLFWFFAPDNWEMLIKTLDACPVNDRLWVFFAATTNVELVVTVTDTETTRVKSYFNPLETTAQTVTDTDAFDTCP
ncbi:MAG TPA: matrixin family metalloprotease [Thermoanaerobaculia bacterium]|nr:matrixin family metalloprotease [Thermoanaerobaculia bacterium]